MLLSDTQIDKTATVLGECISQYGDTEPANITKFQHAIKDELKGKDLNVFGAYRTPDKTIIKALKRAGLTEASFTDVILITFEQNDKIRYYLDGAFHER